MEAPSFIPHIIGTLSAIAVDAQGNACVAGQATTHHACMIKLNADGSTFVYTKVLVGSESGSSRGNSGCGGQLVYRRFDDDA